MPRRQVEHVLSCPRGSSTKASIASISYQLYCQVSSREYLPVCICAFAVVHSRKARRQVFHLMHADRCSFLLPFRAGEKRPKTQRNKIKLQNSNQLIFSSFYLFFCFRRLFLPSYACSYTLAERHRVRNILHLGLGWCTYMYKFYYMPIRHICNVRFNFFRVQSFTMAFLRSEKALFGNNWYCLYIW